MPTPTDFAAAEHLRAAASARDDATRAYLLNPDTLDDMARLYGLDAGAVDLLAHIMTVDFSLLNLLATAGTMPDADCAYGHPPAKVAAIRAAFNIPSYEEYVMHTRMTPPPAATSLPPACVLR